MKAMSWINSLYEIRRDYRKFSLDDKTIKKDPFEQFKLWFDEVLEEGMLEPNAMVLSTATAEGKPSSRVVLLKKYDERGYVFFSNYESRKGKELEENPYASILFFWDKFERQVRIDGKIEKVTRQESDEYFQTRPYTSRLGAWASKQSSVLPSRFTLMRAVAQLMLKYPKQIPLPDQWGGYRLVPQSYEFWQGRESRLHDRFQYEKEGGGWCISRLYP